LYGDIAGLPGLPGCGDQAGEKPAGDIPLASLDALGENPGPPGVIPLPIFGLQTLPPYAGVAPSPQGVIPGVIPPAPLGEATEPKNMPPPPIIPPPTFMGISMPSLHFSASRSKSKQAVPILGS